MRLDRTEGEARSNVGDSHWQRWLLENPNNIVGRRIRWNE